MEQDRLIEQLIDRHVFKLPDGRDLYEGSCEELAGLLKGADKDDKGRS
ncbi:Fur-regulated basic protein FbpA [Bacillus tropicus]